MWIILNALLFKCLDVSIDSFVEYGDIVAASTLTAYVSAANLFVGCYHVMCRHLPMLAG